MKLLECSVCGVLCKTSEDTVTITCSHCVTDLMLTKQPPQQKKNIGYPKGWKFMKEFVHVNGTVYHKGIEQPNLKGTLNPTPIADKPKKTKKQKEQEKMSLIDEYAALKKQLKSEKRKTARKKIELRLNKLSKLI